MSGLARHLPGGPRRFDNSLLVLRAGTLWQEATAAVFLDAIGDGTLPPEAFNRWLVQDYHFADALTSFQGIAAAKTPRQLRKPLIAGLGALDAELDWFEAQAWARGLQLNAPVHEVCRRYCDFLIQAAYREPYPVLLAILVSRPATWWPGAGCHPMDHTRSSLTDGRTRVLRTMWSPYEF